MTDEGWSENDSARFIDDGRIFVPEQEEQLETVCAVLPELADGWVADLCCGAGLLSEAILERHPEARVIALDGSPAMLEATARRAGRFGDRLQIRAFDLAALDWRRFDRSLAAVVSSLAVHHLDGPGKRQLFRDMAAVLSPGGALVIADLIAPTTARAVALAAASWDREVRRRALAIDGHLRAYERFCAEEWNLYREGHTLDPIDRPSSLWEQLGWMQEAGLESVDLHWMKAGHAIFSGCKALAMASESV